MGFFSKPKHDNRQMWLDFIACEEFEDNFVRVVHDFFIFDNINLTKFIENYKVMELLNNNRTLNSWERTNNLSMVEEKQNAKINCTPTFLRYFANNINFLSERSLGVSDWFYSAYPDVMVWIKENFNELEEEIERKEDEFFDENGNIKNILYRTLIDRFKSLNRKLELSD